MPRGFPAEREPDSLMVATESLDDNSLIYPKLRIHERICRNLRHSWVNKGTEENNRSVWRPGCYIAQMSTSINATISFSLRPGPICPISIALYQPSLIYSWARAIFAFFWEYLCTPLSFLLPLIIVGEMLDRPFRPDIMNIDNAAQWK